MQKSVSNSSIFHSTMDLTINNYYLVEGGDNFPWFVPPPAVLAISTHRKNDEAYSEEEKSLLADGFAWNALLLTFLNSLAGFFHLLLRGTQGTTCAFSHHSTSRSLWTFDLSFRKSTVLMAQRRLFSFSHALDNSKWPTMKDVTRITRREQYQTHNIYICIGLQLALT